jgi:phospholipid/cholesterol/gamma-HCH transport system permease protein
MLVGEVPYTRTAQSSSSSPLRLLDAEAPRGAAGTEFASASRFSPRPERLVLIDTDFIEPSPDSFGNRIERVAAVVPQFSWQATSSAGQLEIALGGRISIDDAPALWKRVVNVLDRVLRLQSVRVDLNAVQSIDGACLALLVHLEHELKKRRVDCALVGGTPEVRRMVKLHGRKRLRRRPHRRPQNAVEQVGQSTLEMFRSAVSVLDFFGELLSSVAQAIRNPRSLNLRDVALTMERSGADAVPIILLINFLIGFVMAYQSSLQLKQFGANIFVADLVGLAMTRELGPLMTAIIVCGRSGASFAAELGTMKVSEEVDALRTLGLVPLRYLVLPRVLGLALVAPLLTLLADAVGILGGVLVAATLLDVTPAAFVTELRQAMAPWDVMSGLLKSVVFSAAIALIACQQGLSTSGGAEGVGRRTTSAVVSILFALILLDAVFTVLFGVLGL